MKSKLEDVEMAPVPRVNDQFRKRLHLKRKFKKKMLTFGVIGLLAAFVGGASQPRIRTNQSMSLEFPDLRNSDGTLNLPLYIAADELFMNQNRQKTRPRSPTVFSGPKRFDRTDLTKIKMGTEILASLVSGATDGFIKAQVLSSKGGLNKGALMIGKGSSKDGRLNIRFTKLVHDDGTVQTIQAVAIDRSDRSVGLKGSQVSHYGWKTAAAAGLYFLGGVSAGLTERQSIGGVPTAVPNMRNAALGGVTQATMELATRQMQKAQAAKPRYKIPFGTKIIVLFTN